MLLQITIYQFVISVFCIFGLSLFKNQGQLDLPVLLLPKLFAKFKHLEQELSSEGFSRFLAQKNEITMINQKEIFVTSSNQVTLIKKFREIAVMNKIANSKMFYPNVRYVVRKTFHSACTIHNLISNCNLNMYSQAHSS